MNTPKTMTSREKRSEDRRHRLLESVGNTPLVEMTRVARDVAPVKIFGKAEWFNPGGSVKDRPALNKVLEGERSGQLTHDKIILDATSGNTGVAYAMIGAALGYRVKLAVPRNIGTLRMRILEAYGAEVVLTNPQLGSDGAILEAIRLYKENPELYFYPDQYNNPANWKAHYSSTAEEILRQTNGEITHFVAGLGTSGTFVGASRRLKEFNGKIQAIAVQPDSPFHGLEGMKHMESSIVPGIYDPALADQMIMVRTEDAQDMTRRLAREEGLLVGMSSGATMVAALQVARKLTSGIVVVVLADNGHKYLDLSFWRDKPRDR